MVLASPLMLATIRICIGGGSRSLVISHPFSDKRRSETFIPIIFKKQGIERDRKKYSSYSFFLSFLDSDDLYGYVRADNGKLLDIRAISRAESRRQLINFLGMDYCPCCSKI